MSNENENQNTEAAAVAADPFDAFMAEAVERWQAKKAASAKDAPQDADGDAAGGAEAVVDAAADTAATTGEAEESAAVTPYELAIPADVPISSQDKWGGTIKSFGAAAASAGIPHTVSQELVNTFVDCDIAIGGYGGGPITERMYTDADCAWRLKMFWGDTYDARLAEVRKIVAARPALSRWLNESEMGNNPGALIALSLTREMRMSKKEAAAELQRVMRTPEYLKGDKQTALQTKVLSRIAYAGTEERASVADTRARVLSQTDTTKASLRKEAAELIEKNKTAGRWPADDLQKFHSITVRLSKT